MRWENQKFVKYSAELILPYKRGRIEYRGISRLLEKPYKLMYVRRLFNKWFKVLLLGFTYLKKLKIVLRFCILYYLYSCQEQ